MQTTKLASLLMIFVSVALNAAAQLLLKQGTKVAGLAAVDLETGFGVLARASYSAWIWAGLGAYVVSVVLWILVLSRVDVSYAYPMVSLGYLMAAAAGKLLLQEQVSLTRAAGIAIVCVGVVVVSRG